MNIVNLTNESNSTNNAINEIDLAFIIIQIFLSVITVILNLLCIVLISITLIQKKTYSNIIFLLISITDFIVGMISVPGSIFLTFTHGGWTFSMILCVIYKTFDFANGNISLMLLLVITVHRFLQLKDPFKQKEKMNRWRWMLILLLFISNYGICLVIWYIYHIYTGKEENICIQDIFNIYIYVYNCVVSIGTFILIIIMNALMLREFIIKKSKTLVRHFKKEDNAIFCILAITANLVVTWGLFIIIWPIKTICTGCVWNNLFIFSYLLNYAFAAVNPIILLVFNKNYRDILRKFFCNKK